MSDVTLIDWPAARQELGLEEHERLYYGFHTARPGDYVDSPIAVPGTPVFTDGGLLKHRFWLEDQGEVQHSSARLDAATRGSSSELNREASIYAAFFRSGIYFRDDLCGEQELALSILSDLYNEETALRLYRDLAEEVVNRLPLEEWFLTSRQIHSWLAERTD